MDHILEDFLVMTEQGIYCSYGDFYIDARHPVHTCLISHAHGDHAIAGHGNVYCTPPTKDLMQVRYGKKTAGQFACYEYGNVFTVGGVEVYFLSAGHMLGSSQIMMVYKGVKYLYTGDYKLQPDATCMPIVLEKADVLITESTFAHPDTTHPPVEAEIAKLRDVGFNILLGTYALGKAQRLTQLINAHCPQLEVFVHHRIAPFHQVYEQYGVRDWQYKLYNRKALKEKSAGAVYMVPPMTFNSYIRAKNVIRVFASGWSHLQRGNALSLYISDHVDWHDILYTISQVAPRQLWTLHGNGNHLKKHFDEKMLVKAL
ncbi:MBL fold metallo-hydrolase [Olivibacter sitiensis]|uniref:MBL fold metallo-hydrolase n=1 Tax=Olivibacter sitiensis TaxID=376470 RepID=UPI00040D7C65|nr:MBL fold metallo-hydrolase [Olivibacter sitiensis]